MSEGKATEVHGAAVHTKLGELPATAICGNDITSSCLYVSALAIVYSGKFAWLALLMVAAVLFLFRKVYAEVVGALPLNGGAYNALLNTTSKAVASMAACLTLLSYMATAVISASEAMHYLHSLAHSLPVIPATVVLLAVFMALTIVGIGESSKVAVGIFLAHIGSLSVLLVAGGLFVLNHGTEILQANFATPAPGGPARALFFGFAAAMLGISGFESSANFVEEQEDGVFPKTLRNMWLAVSFFNPAMALLALALVRIPQVPGHQEALLAHMGSLAAGGWLATLISVDAVLVLSGAVLTSFVGVTGLIRRMTLDRVLPQFLLKTNRRGTSHRIIVGFFLLSVSVLFITQGDIPALAGVYTISFLAVMALFGIGNVLLKVRRARLPRPQKASWLAVITGILAVLAGLVGNAVLNPAYLGVFAAYFIPAVIFIAVMLWRIGLLNACLAIVRSIAESVEGATARISEAIRARIADIQSQQVVFFTRGDSVATLNRAMLYVGRNEHTNRIKVVTVVNESNPLPERLKGDLEYLDQAYPAIDIEFVTLQGDFGPELIEGLSAQWKIPTNFMFIGSPGDHFPYRLSELGGVRLII
jgi:amino acid transporter